MSPSHRLVRSIQAVLPDSVGSSSTSNATPSPRWSHAAPLDLPALQSSSAEYPWCRSSAGHPPCRPIHRPGQGLARSRSKKRAILPRRGEQRLGRASRTRGRVRSEPAAKGPSPLRAAPAAIASCLLRTRSLTRNLVVRGADHLLPPMRLASQATSLARASASSPAPPAPPARFSFRRRRRFEPPHNCISGPARPPPAAARSSSTPAARAAEAHKLNRSRAAQACPP